MAEFWLISAPGDRSPQQTWEKCKVATKDLSLNYKLILPELKVNCQLRVFQNVNISSLSKLAMFVKTCHWPKMVTFQLVFFPHLKFRQYKVRFLEHFIFINVLYSIKTKSILINFQCLFYYHTHFHCLKTTVFTFLKS